MGQQIEEMDAIDFATDKSEIDVQIKSVFDKIASLSTQKQQSQHQSKQSIEIQNALNIEDKGATEQCLLQRYRMYRFAAKKAKDSGNKATAIQYIKQSKLIKNCIEQIREGLVVWTSDIPPILDNELWNIASVQKQKIEEMDAIDFATDKSEIDVQIKSVFDKISSLSTQKQQSQHQSKQSIEIQNALNI